MCFLFVIPVKRKMSQTTTSSKVEFNIKKVIVWALILIVVAAISQEVLFSITGVPGVMYNKWPEEQTCGVLYGSIGLTFLIVAGMAFLTKKSYFTVQEAAVLMAVALIASSPIGTMFINIDIYEMFVMSEPTNYDKYVNWLVPGWNLPRGLADAFLYGGLIPWASIFSTFIVHILVMTLWIYFALFVALLTRRQIVDSEKLPFPYLQPGLIALEYATKEVEGKPMIFGKLPKEFVYGIIIGILAYLIFIPAFYVPSLADFLPFMKETGGAWRMMWYIDFTPQLRSVIPWAPMMGHLQPELLASLWFLPMNVLITAGGLSLFVQYILPPIAIALGRYKDPATGKIWYQEWPLDNPVFGVAYTNFRYNGLIDFWSLFSGAVAVYAILKIIFNPRPFLDSVKGIWSKVQGEENEPIPYRYMWAGIVVLGVILMGVMSWIGIPLAVAAIELASIGLLFAGVAFFGAECGVVPFWKNDPGLGGELPIGTIKALNLMPETGREAWAYATWHTDYAYGYFQSVAPSYNIIAGYKAADATKTKTKNVFILQLIAIPVIIFLYAFLYITTAGLIGKRIGWKGSSGWWGAGEWIVSWYPTFFKDFSFTAANFAAIDPNYGLEGWVVGAIIMAINMLLTRLFVWWPISTAAFLVFGEYSIVKLYFALVVVFIAKYLVLKIGGTRLYEQTTKVAAGVLVGALIGLLILQVVALGGAYPNPPLA
jgi:hypothetical protein